MKNMSIMSLFATGVSSLLVFATPVLADTNHYVPGHEIRQNRVELRRDQAELARDRADLRQLYHSGASRADIRGKKQEVRSDVRQVAQGRREIRHDYAALRRDGSHPRFGASRWGDNRSHWYRHDNGRRRWGGDRFGHRGHWSQGFARR